MLSRSDLPQPDLSWWVEEEKVYKDKDVLTIEVPDIPHDAFQEPEFWSKLKSRMSTIDKSAQDHLTAWIDVPYSLLGKHEDVHRQLHENSQGLVKLDRHIANKVYEKGVSWCDCS